MLKYLQQETEQHSPDLHNFIVDLSLSVSLLWTLSLLPFMIRTLILKCKNIQYINIFKPSVILGAKNKVVHYLEIHSSST